MLYLPSPVEELYHPIFENAACSVWIKRDDLIHPYISGNKWRKLKYNLHYAIQHNLHTLISYGGAYSNHLLALAAAGKAAGLRTLAIIRGEKPENLNPVLKKMMELGLEPHYISRSEYRQKKDIDIEQLTGIRNDDYLLIPEGGANVLALPGVDEIWDEVETSFDYVITAVGTGATYAGLQLRGSAFVVGIAVLKGGAFLRAEAEALLHQYYQITGSPSVAQNNSGELITDYHFGGYAKAPSELKSFSKTVSEHFNIDFEPVYTGKMMYGLLDLLQKGYFKKNSKILVLHTGGVFSKQLFT